MTFSSTDRRNSSMDMQKLLIHDKEPGQLADAIVKGKCRSDTLTELHVYELFL